jgi:hypothetical protein
VSARPTLLVVYSGAAQASRRYTIDSITLPLTKNLHRCISNLAT